MVRQDACVGLLQDFQTMNRWFTSDSIDRSLYIDLWVVADTLINWRLIRFGYNKISGCFETLVDGRKVWVSFEFVMDLVNDPTSRVNSSGYVIMSDQRRNHVRELNIFQSREYTCIKPYTPH